MAGLDLPRQSKAVYSQIAKKEKTHKMGNKGFFKGVKLMPLFMLTKGEETHNSKDIELRARSLHQT